MTAPFRGVERPPGPYRRESGRPPPHCQHPSIEHLQFRGLTNRRHGLSPGVNTERDGGCNQTEKDLEEIHGECGGEWEAKEVLGAEYVLVTRLISFLSLNLKPLGFCGCF